MGQLVATTLTFGLAAIVLILVVRLCLKEKVAWPLLVLISGLITCLMEPLFDNLYGLYFFEKGQWHLYTTFDSAQPIWLPPAYLAFYGGAAVYVVRALQAQPAMSTVWRMYWQIVAMAIVSEISYISVLGVYEYQGNQPFVMFGYPIFLGFTNAMSALVGGIIIYRVLPKVKGRIESLSLVPVIPGAFAMGLFGSGIVYLSVRQIEELQDTILLHLAALTVVIGIASTINLFGKSFVVRPDSK
ncbi:hypothetical protein D0911_03850 [Zhongshania marina]|uniref:Carotenoid biosynthesis protein n=2 Tax=Zhongshania marina TaxID=2304603 RepID=A0A2S4HJ76_9GAMM|nr:hypothetical protein C0068_03715 [Marortus luteolus]RNL66806.1 hypothetical protein D0911_03850 [Zhongshania marina]